MGPELRIDGNPVGLDHPTFFIADISANHDGDLSRAKDLIYKAAESGANAAKFQNFRADKIVSGKGFAGLKKQLSHQAKWKKSVVEVYQDASLPFDWTDDLKKTCDIAKISFFSTPYDFEAVDHLDPYVSVFKIGSGDIDWLEFHSYIASKNKPILLAAGAATSSDIQRVMDNLEGFERGIALMQCNTNYTGSIDNFRHIHLNVLKTFALNYPHAVLGLSDHTPGHATVLGAVALGARIIEKHFTDDNHRDGPDHPFSMTPSTWREMVDRTRELELAMGSSVKQIAKNEIDSVVVQRRSMRAARDLLKGHQLTRDDIAVLRPAPHGSLSPVFMSQILGNVLTSDVSAGSHFRPNDFAHELSLG
jgi:sialic acid synthase SpsE